MTIFLTLYLVVAAFAIGGLIWTLRSFSEETQKMNDIYQEIHRKEILRKVQEDIADTLEKEIKKMQ